MQTAAAIAYRPKWPGLPAAPSTDFWGETEWKILIAIMDAVIPPISRESKATGSRDERAIPDAEYEALFRQTKEAMAVPPDEALFRAYMEDCPSANKAFIAGLERAVNNIPEKLKKDLGGALKLMSGKVGSYLLTGYTTPINEQPLLVREKILKSWQVSWLPSLRLLYKSLTLLAKNQSPATRTPPPGMEPGQDFDYKFLQFEPGNDPAVLETDVVIVGSGCGGGVCAKVLTEAGHSVLVVDKGYYFPPSQLPMPAAEAVHHLFEGRGLLGSVDASANLVAGACWGGGGTVNWSVGLQTQGYVRREWAEEHGLPFFATQAFQDCLDRVCDFMGVGDAAVRQNHRGRVMLEGARRLGWDAKPAPQNTGGKPHWCGHCHLGCGSADKQGPAVSWLPAAARAGAKFAEGFKVDRITFDDDGNGEKKATGVVGTWTSRDTNGGVTGPVEERVQREVVVKAKRVIVSSGSLWSPLILMNSGVKNPHLGQNLHIHPVNMVGAFYDEDVRPWEGGIITSYCTTFENLDGHGHGVKLEPTCMLPFAAISGFPWHSGLDFKLAAVRYRQFNAFISLCRDRDTGSVFPNSTTGGPTVKYRASVLDCAHILEGVIALAKICYITGAREIHAFLPGTKPFVRERKSKPQQEGTSSVPVTNGSKTNGADEAVREEENEDDDDEKDDEVDLGVSDPAFVAWLDGIRAVGNRPPAAFVSSAHQMGTCRMSSHRGAGVVDPRGAVWGTRGLYVADASVFPSASGVNPMVTNMAISDWIARGVAAELGKGD